MTRRSGKSSGKNTDSPASPGPRRRTAGRKQLPRRRQPPPSRGARFRQAIGRGLRWGGRKLGAGAAAFFRWATAFAREPGHATARSGRRKKVAGRRLSWKRVAVWGAVAGIWGLVGFAIILGYFALTLPDVSQMAETSRRPSVTMLDREGAIFATYGEVYGESIFVEDLPPHLPHAVLATEDRRFYDHGGVDPWGIARAMYVNLREGAFVQGGSTITQQLAKNLFLTNERTFVRKIRELMLALWLEHKFNKDQILTLYLNRVYLGAGTYGVDAAARRYFGKPATDVTLYEAAMLAGLLKAPSRYNPASNPVLARQRTQVILAAMVDAGYITEDEAESAAPTSRVASGEAASDVRYFSDWVMRQVEAYVGAPNEDLVVRTTLDPAMQVIAEAEIDTLLREAGPQRNVEQAALVSMRPDGAVRAMVGGRSYAQSQFNRATQAQRQPGSAFKIFVYMAGIEAGLSPDRRFVDSPIQVEGWSPGNFADKYYGEVTLREAFARSLNSVAVRISEQVGRDRVVTAAKRLGITTDLSTHPSIALGASEVTLLDLTGAYAAFARGGRGVWPYAVLEIRTRDGRQIWQREGGGPGRVVGPRTVAYMTDLMRANVRWGTGKAAQPGNRPAAGKTGTSQDFRDAWFVGFTAHLVTGVWFGNDDGAPMNGVTGGSLPALAWRNFTTEALKGVPPAPLPGSGVAMAGSDYDDDGGASSIGLFIERVFDSVRSGFREPGSDRQPPSDVPPAGSGSRDRSERAPAKPSNVEGVRGVGN